MTNPVPGRSPYLWIVGVIVALDQVTKALVDDFMTLHESRTIVEGLVRLTYVQNRGAAFGILSEAGLPYQSLMFSVVSLLALLAIALYAWRMPVQSRLPQTAPRRPVVSCARSGTVSSPRYMPDDSNSST